MKHAHIVTALATVVMIGAAGIAAHSLAASPKADAKTAEAYPGERLAAQARVPLAQARAIALTARPGQIVAQELEKEGGGSGLRYSFDIKAGGKTYEVGVDARDGQVLENGTESASKEKSEQRHEGT